MPALCAHTVYGASAVLAGWLAGCPGCLCVCKWILHISRERERERERGEEEMSYGEQCTHLFRCKQASKQYNCSPTCRTDKLKHAVDKWRQTWSMTGED